MKEARPLVVEAVQEAPPTWARWFVWAFLLSFVVCGIVGIEAWPLTGWRLFSHVRAEHQVTFQAFAVDPGGVEYRVAFVRLAPAYRNFTLIASKLEELSEDRMRATCRAWAEAVGRTGTPLVALRVYRLDWDLVPRRHGRAAVPPVRTLVYECDASD